MAVSLGSAVLTIGGDSSGLHQSLRHAEGVTRSTLTQVATASRALGYTFTAIGTSISGALALAVREAISFESAFAGVRKTMEASEAEFAVINRALRDMSLTIPVSANELARIAELGAQLGIRKEDIMAFTRTIADMSVATDMTSEAAATMLAQFINITQINQSKIANLGATIVALGNNGASTENQIAEFALRLAGAGKVAGLSAPEILGFGSALASVGIEAEAGGTAFSKVFIMLASAVDQGGESVAQFAQVAGMSSEQFVAAFKDNPTQAIIAFVEGLGKIEAAGGSLFGVLQELDIKETRLRDALLRTSGAGKLVAENITLANQAFKDNSALTDEATKRYATTESQIQILKNTFAEMARTVGEVLLPPLRGAVERVREVVTWVTEWMRANPVLTETIIKVAAVVGAAMIAIGPLLVALPGLAIAFAALASPIGIAAAAIGGALVVGVLLLRDHITQAKVWVTENWDRIVAVFESARQAISSIMQIIGQVFRAAWLVVSAVFTAAVRTVSDKFQELGDSTGKYSDDWLGTLQMVLDWVNENLPAIVETVKSMVDWLSTHWETIVSAAETMYALVSIPLMALANKFIAVKNIVMEAASGIRWAVNLVAGWLGLGGGGVPADGGGPSATPQIPERASGGTASGLTWVGERGPELVNLPHGSYVHSARNSKQMAAGGLGGGGGVNMGGVSITVLAANDPHETSRMVLVELEKAFQNKFASRGLRLSTA